MVKIVKSISLDEHTAPIANSKRNFSAWVRQQLLEDIQYAKPCVYFKVKHRALKVYNPETGGWSKAKDTITEEICNGQAKPSCVRCYPQGPPKQEDWLLYATGRITKVELLDSAAEHWKWKTDQIEEKKRQISEGISKNQENDPKRGGDKPKRAYVRRLLSFLWSFIW